MAQLVNDPAYRSMIGFESVTDSLESTISASKGQPTMFDEDMKVALVQTMIALQHQIKINESLIERVLDLEEKNQKKSFFRK